MKILGTYYLTETIPHYPYKVNLDFLIDLDFQLNFGIIKGRAVLEGHSPEMFKGNPYTLGIKLLLNSITKNIQRKRVCIVRWRKHLVVQDPVFV